jgi:hypothetical protein
MWFPPNHPCNLLALDWAGTNEWEENDRYDFFIDNIMFYQQSYIIFFGVHTNYVIFGISCHMRKSVTGHVVRHVFSYTYDQQTSSLVSSRDTW